MTQKPGKLICTSAETLTAPFVNHYFHHDNSVDARGCNCEKQGFTLYWFVLVFNDSLTDKKKATFFYMRTVTNVRLHIQK